MIQPPREGEAEERSHSDEDSSTASTARP